MRVRERERRRTDLHAKRNRRETVEERKQRGSVAMLRSAEKKDARANFIHSYFFTYCTEFEFLL